MKPQDVGVTAADLLSFSSLLLLLLDFPISFMIPGIGCDVSCLQPTLITKASREVGRSSF